MGLSLRGISCSQSREVSLLKMDSSHAATTISTRPVAGLQQALLLTAGLSTRYKTELVPRTSWVIRMLSPPFCPCAFVLVAVLKQSPPALTVRRLL